tara:strand:- start:839 stop:1171 length:333 start_codon:yes stop_codon:yes gene_type:complete
MLNRCALILRPARPFIEWARNLDDSGIVPSAEGEQTVYLLPEYDDDADALELLSKMFDVLFEMQLDGWHTDESAWPRNRTFAMFREWFSIEFHSVVEDMCDYPIVDDEYA